VTLTRQHIFLCFPNVLKDEVSQDSSSYEFCTRVHHKDTMKVVSPAQRVTQIHSVAAAATLAFRSVLLLAGCTILSYVGWQVVGTIVTLPRRGSVGHTVRPTFIFSHNMNTDIDSVVQLITPLNGIIILLRVILRIVQTGTFWATAFKEILSCFSALFLKDLNWGCWYFEGIFSASREWR
jgi:hypothetical protein